MKAIGGALLLAAACGGRVDGIENVASSAAVDPGVTVVDCSGTLDGYPLDFLVTIDGPKASLQFSWAGPDMASAVRSYPNWNGTIALDVGSTTLEWQRGCLELQDTKGLVTDSVCR